MANFDIKFLFSNIPIKDTCNIILEKLFPLPDIVFDSNDELCVDLFKVYTNTVV